MAKSISAFLLSSLILAFSLPPLPAQSTGEEFKLDGRIALNGFRGLVDEHLGGVLSGLKALAATQDASSRDWERIKGPLAQLSARTPTVAAMWFAKPDGSYSTVATGATGESLKDRDYFPALLAGKDVEGSLVISKSTGARSVIVATPVIKDGQVIGALGASLSLENLSKLVRDDLGLPQSVIFYALDAEGRTVLHGTENLIFEYPSDIGDASLKSAVKTMLGQPQGVLSYTYQGSPRTVIYEKSPTTGWVFVLGTPSVR